MPFYELIKEEKKNIYLLSKEVYSPKDEDSHRYIKNDLSPIMDIYVDKDRPWNGCLFKITNRGHNKQYGGNLFDIAFYNESDSAKKYYQLQSDVCSIIDISPDRTKWVLTPVSSSRWSTPGMEIVIKFSDDFNSVKYIEYRDNRGSNVTYRILVKPEVNIKNFDLIE